jgi:hypothetical protein
LLDVSHLGDSKKRPRSRRGVIGVTPALAVNRPAISFPSRRLSAS